MRVRIIIALVALQISTVLKVMRFALNHAGRRMIRRAYRTISTSSKRLSTALHGSVSVASASPPAR